MMKHRKKTDPTELLIEAMLDFALVAGFCRRSDSWFRSLGGWSSEQQRADGTELKNIGRRRPVRLGKEGRSVVIGTQRAL
jgi:hypothetical protein